jgi:hypothetical protein
MRVAPTSEGVRFGGPWVQLEQRNLNKYDFYDMISRKCSSQPQIDIKLR